MKQYIRKIGILLIPVAALIMYGCLLISGTFVIVEPFSFTTHTGFYHYEVDITDQKDWDEHRDDINEIDLVGFEMWFDNPSGSQVIFDAYIDAYDAPEYSGWSQVDANAQKVLDSLPLPPGSTHLTYGSSFAYVGNVEAMKKLVKAGQFRFYGVASGGSAANYQLDSGRIVVTFSASK